jgi:hypothetical protein
MPPTAPSGSRSTRFFSDSRIRPLADFRNVAIAVIWHADTFYAAIEVMEAAGVPFDAIKLVTGWMRCSAGGTKRLR